MDKFLDAFGLPPLIIARKKFLSTVGQSVYQVQDEDVLFDILGKHMMTPVQLLRDVCASLWLDDIVELLDSFEFRSLHLVRSVKELEADRKPIHFLQRGAVLIAVPRLLNLVQVESFFKDLDSTSQVITLETDSPDFRVNLQRTLDTWRETQGE